MSSSKVNDLGVGEGWRVYWYDGGHKTQPPAVALVAQVGMGSQVNLAILHPNLHNFVCKDGVRHIADKGLRDDERATAGAWDFHPLDAPQVPPPQPKAVEQPKTEPKTEPKK
jgi:hypothetical protein